MMANELLDILPADTPSATTLTVLTVLALVGIGVWLLGSRFGRTINTLLGVLLGAGIGMQLPHWFGWSIDGMACAVGGAVVLGIVAFAMTRAWTALGLGVVTFLWGILGAYVAFNETEGWQLPDKADLNLPQYVKAIYESLPEDLSKYMALAGLTSFVSGLSIGMIWPRIGRVLFHSMAGLTLIVGCGLTCIYYRRPDWIDYLPEQNWAQLVTLFGSVLFGALVQWQVMPRNAGTEKKKKKKSADDLDFEAHQARLNL